MKNFRQDLYTRKQQFEVMRQSFMSLPRWFRGIAKSKRVTRRDQEEARRRRQIAGGVLGPSSRGVVEVRDGNV